MKRTTYPLLLAVALGISAPAYASDDERPDHFKGKQAESIEQAYENLSVYNRKLEKLLEGELTPQAMAEIHQVTYTLENALQKLNREIDDVAETLEELHLASERNETAVTQEKGKAYLETAKKIVRD
ncbi:MAG TPA: DUF6746 family protein, partial [Gammaproteobacteria bacterium]